MPDPTPHFVNTDLKLFVNPLDIDVPSSEHPCLPLAGAAVVTLRFVQATGNPYALTERDALAVYVTLDGQLVYGCQSHLDMKLNQGLDGYVTFSLNRNLDTAISTGTAQMSVVVNGVVLLNDSVSIVDAPMPNPVGCGCRTAPVMTNLGVIEEYIAPSEELDKQYVLYLGATGQLIRGCVYKCSNVDGTWTWVPKTDPADDNLRLVEWQP